MHKQGNGLLLWNAKTSSTQFKRLKMFHLRRCLHRSNIRRMLNTSQVFTIRRLVSKTFLGV